MKKPGLRVQLRYKKVTLSGKRSPQNFRQKFVRQEEDMRAINPRGGHVIIPSNLISSASALYIQQSTSTKSISDQKEEESARAIHLLYPVDDNFSKIGFFRNEDEGGEEQLQHASPRGSAPLIPPPVKLLSTEKYTRARGAAAHQRTEIGPFRSSNTNNEISSNNPTGSTKSCRHC